MSCGSWIACWLGLVSAAGCTTGMDMSRRDAQAGAEDGGRIDSGSAMDAGRTCTTDPHCDDGHACTFDTCAVGNVCDYQPVDELCRQDERCVVGRGCVMAAPSVCETDPDCDDGAFCNGVERCLGPAGSRSCVAGGGLDCDDGNSCTTDMCDESIDGCTYGVAPGCDAGTAVGDGGVACEPFVPSTGYTGTYAIRPTVASACLRATWTIDSLTLSASGGNLSGATSAFTMTSTEAPSGPDFTLTYDDTGCARHELIGTFMCANRFRGTWRVTFSGECSLCGSVSTTTVVGIRR